MTTSALVLHGGGGPFTVAGLAEHLSSSFPTTAPTHPGWNGTPLDVDSIGELAQRYLDELAATDSTDVLVVGSSLGGWIGAEMAARDREGRVASLVLIDAVGIAVDGEDIRDFAALDPRTAAGYSWHDAERYFVDPSTLPPERVALQRGNMASMKALAPSMQDPALAGRLAAVGIPVLAIWGESDGIVTPAYGKAFAELFERGEFVGIPEAGHLPQLEQPAATFAALDVWLAR